MSGRGRSAERQMQEQGMGAQNDRLEPLPNTTPAGVEIRIALEVPRMKGLARRTVAAAAHVFEQLADERGQITSQCIVGTGPGAKYQVGHEVGLALLRNVGKDRAAQARVGVLKKDHQVPGFSKVRGEAAIDRGVPLLWLLVGPARFASALARA